MIVAVEQLNIKLYKLFYKELLNLNIGYQYDRLILKQMMDIINAINYINSSNPSKKEIEKIINYYE
jgi:hypothetical protein